MFNKNGKNQIWLTPIIKIKNFLYEANFLKELRIEKVELLPYHALGEHKYLALKMPLPKYTVPTQEKMEKLKELFE